MDNFLVKWFVVLVVSVLSHLIVKKLNELLKISERNIFIRIIYIIILFIIALFISLFIVIFLSNNGSTHPDFTKRVALILGGFIFGGIYGYNVSFRVDK